MSMMNGKSDLVREQGCGGDVRIIRKLDVREGPTGEGRGIGPFMGLVLDVETTGLDFDRDAIIQLAIRRFRYDQDGVITHIDGSREWTEDPGRPLPPQIAMLTGLRDAQLKGRFIEEEEAAKLFSTASLVIAHHSRFDRRWVERRLEDARGLDWACTMEQIDWQERGFDGRALGYLLAQAGFFHDGHRAAADVDAVIQLLRHRFEDGRTALSVLMERSSRPSWIVRAVGADFGAKDVLRSRGYRWDSVRKNWWIEVDEEARSSEEYWLAANIYCPTANPRAMGPTFEEITARTRFL